jgi:hypothetical protein
VSDIVVTSDTGITAIVQTAAPLNIVVSGALQGGQGIQGVQGDGVPLGGLTGQYLVKTSSADNATAWQTPLNGASVQNTVTQTAHGFTTGQILQLNASGYALAQADTQAHADVIGIVSNVLDANHFVLTTEGYVTNLGGLPIGVTQFLSAATAGALTTIEPTTVGQYSKPLLVADSNTSGYFHNYRGERAGS